MILGGSRLQRTGRILGTLAGGVWGVIVVEDPTAVGETVHWSIPSYYSKDKPLFCAAVRHFLTLKALGAQKRLADRHLPDRSAFKKRGGGDNTGSHNDNISHYADRRAHLVTHTQTHNERIESKQSQFAEVVIVETIACRFCATHKNSNVPEHFSVKNKVAESFTGATGIPRCLVD